MENLQSEAVSKFRNNYRSTLSKLSNGPVLLLQNSKIAAVLVSPDEWSAQQKELKRFRLDQEARQAFARYKRGETETISHDELKRQMLQRRTENVGN